MSNLLKTNASNVYGQIYVSYINFNSGNTQYFNQQRPQLVENLLGFMTIKQFSPPLLVLRKHQPIQKTNLPHHTLAMQNVEWKQQTKL